MAELAFFDDVFIFFLAIVFVLVSAFSRLILKP